MIVIPVILSGGIGSRLWPLSRETLPKQFIPLLGRDHTLFQETLLRVNEPSFFNPPLILCQETHRFMVLEQLKKIAKTPEAIMLEPVGRSTAPCIALAAFYAIKKNPEAILLVLSADQLIGSASELTASIQAALPAIRSNYLTTFGIKPTAPETGYGYLKIGKVLSQDINEVSSFVEKPSKELAKVYVDSQDYFWNAGIFLFKAADYLNELSQHAPQIYEHCQQAMALAKKDIDFIRPDREKFESCPSNSIDYAVMEKSNRVAMVKLNTTWNDVGSWEALANCFEKDDKGNSLQGQAVLKDSSNCHVHATHRFVSVVGGQNLVVVETKDAILVADQQKSQQIKELVQQLTESNRPEVKQASCVARPWGSFESIDQGERYQVKRITVAVGAKLSLQLHHHRSEHWVVVKGTAKVTRGQEEFLLSENQSTYIPIGVVHRLENIGKIPLEIIEIQSGAYLGEDDIIRLEDNYGRREEMVEKD